MHSRGFLKPWRTFISTSLFKAKQDLTGIIEIYVEMNASDICVCVAILLTVCSGLVLPDRTHTKLLTVPNGGSYGYWGEPEFCPVGTFASGYSMKIEPNQFFGDDTTLNAIRLVCSGNDGHMNTDHQITSSEGPYGTWSKTETCNQHFGDPSFLTSFQLQVEASQGGGDDTSANYINFRCRPFETEENTNLTETILSVAPGHGIWGTWSEWTDSCEPDQAICGIRTKVESGQGDGDDTALNDVLFYCCDTAANQIVG